jgi:hypothetical protein
VILTYDVEVSARMWLVADYLPELARLYRESFPSLDSIATWLGARMDPMS